MDDFLKAITLLLNKPEVFWGGHLVAGFGLSKGVWWFSDLVEKKLRGQVKKDIARWLMDVRMERSFNDLQEAILPLLDPSDLRKAQIIPVLLFIVLFLGAILQTLLHMQDPSNSFAHIFREVYLRDAKLQIPLSLRLFPLKEWTRLVFLFKITALGMVGCGFPTSLAFSLSAEIMNCIKRVNQLWKRIGLLFVQTFLSFYCGLCGLVGFTVLSAFWYGTPSIQEIAPIGLFGTIVQPHQFLFGLWSAGGPVIWGASSLFTTSGLVLFVVSGILLKSFHRLDIGFRWFNRKFDIEKNPLSCIGLVAGVLVALVYWGAVIVSRVV